MPATTNPTDREVTTMKFFATVMAANAEQAIETVGRQLDKLEGFTLTGRTGVRSEKHMLRTVEIEAARGADRNDAWVVLTSYGITPAKELGSVWQTVAGVGC